MSTKADFQCAHCHKILKTPIILPCICESICHAHLDELKSVCSIECSTCKRVFNLSEHEFKINKLAKSLIEKDIFLSDEEKHLKQSLKDSIESFFATRDNLELSKNVTLNESHAHFQEIRRKIDLQREELIDKIDKYALTMIDATSHVERSYKLLIENILPPINGGTASSSCLDDEIQNLNESFRDVNLTIDSIKEMSIKRDTINLDLHSYFDHFNRTKEILLSTNQFIPNLQFDKNSFGTLTLKEIERDPFKSLILSTSKLLFDLVRLCDFSTHQKWTLLYRGTRDGFGARNFHLKCDGHSRTLTIIRSLGTKCIFGGYTEACWEARGGNCFDEKAFIFSLINNDNKPLKIKVSKPSSAIHCRSHFGPVFGGSFINEKGKETLRGDLRIGGKVCSVTGMVEDSYSYLGENYKHPLYEFGTSEANAFLAGSWRFKIDEIEIYQKE
jgi:hypothetical protein